MRSIDRILLLEKIDKSNKDTGLMDPSVFTGKNNLHAVMDEKCMWSFKYEHGHVPPQLRSKFTDFKTAKNFAENYLLTKNIKITGVID